MTLSLWLIPLLPLAGFLVNGLVGSRLPKALVTTVALAAPLAAFLVVVRAALAVANHSVALPYSESCPIGWINAGPIHIDFTFALDQLSLIMLLVVTGVGFLIHIYSAGYMAHEDGYWRYFAYLNLFLFFMTVLVLAENALLMFVGWEGVGLASYLLIGFYFSKTSAANAGRKAFVVNRIGDFGFLIAIFLLLANFGTVSFSGLAAALAASPGTSVALLTTISLCLLLGASGKSAQIPLYIWLPDAMEGPTPVSALIHAATMVTAGVYMVARTHFLFDRAPLALTVVAIVGAATAIFAATIGLVQTDIKRVLAYSTVSQLGYMFLGCGVAAYSAAVFHLVTHAFFKALLFLAAGSVIHGLSGEQDLRKMGGLRKKLPVTFWTMSAGVFAIAGFPLLSGFFSKDAILAAAFNQGAFGKGLYVVGLITALLTSFYMFRLWYLAFFGESRADDHSHHPHESPWSMLGPLVILAILSVFGGWMGAGEGLGRFGAFLAPVLTPLHPAEPVEASLEYALMGVAVAVALLGWFLAHRFYGSKNDCAKALAASAPGVYRLLSGKYFIDELYNRLLVQPVLFISRYILGWIVEGAIVRGSVWVAAGLINLLGEFLRRWQSGNIRSYAGWLVTAAAILLFAVLGVTLGSAGITVHFNWVGH